MFLKFKLQNGWRYLSRRRNFNVFHCCLQKTATQWFMRTLMDVASQGEIRMLHITGGNKIPRQNNWRESLQAIPDGTIVSPLYIRASDFLESYRNRPFRAFYVIRDPRDLVVSDYFSLKDTHPIQNEYYAEWRYRLNCMDQESGIMARIENMDWNFFEPLRGWAEVKHPDIRIIKFEDFFGPEQRGQFLELLAFLQLDVSESLVDKLLEKRSFANKAKQKNKEGKSHYRSGKVGDWRNYFTDAHVNRFKEVAGDLLTTLGYEASDDWA